MSTRSTSTLVTRIIAILALMIGVGWAIYKEQYAPAAPTQQTQPAHPLAQRTLQGIDGQPVSMAPYAKQVLVINFWASWCPPCVSEIPELNRLYPELKAKNIELLGIAIDSPSNIREFLQKHAIDYPIVAGGLGGSTLANELGNVGGALPFTVLLRTDGSVAWKKLGTIKPEELQAAVNSL